MNRVKRSILFLKLSRSWQWTYRFCRSHNISRVHYVHMQMYMYCIHLFGTIWRKKFFGTWLPFTTTVFESVHTSVCHRKTTSLNRTSMFYIWHIGHILYTNCLEGQFVYFKVHCVPLPISSDFWHYCGTHNNQCLAFGILFSTQLVWTLRTPQCRQTIGRFGLWLIDHTMLWLRYVLTSIVWVRRLHV